MDRSEDQRVRDPPPPRVRIRDQTEPAEVQLALHPRLAVGDPQRRLPAAEPAPLDGEPVQRPVRHRDPAAGQLAVDVGQLQLVTLDPVPDPRLLDQQRLPRLPVSGPPGRPDHGHHRAHQLVGQLRLTALAREPGRDRGLHIAAGGLAVHTGPLRSGAQPDATQPAAQHLSDLDHCHLPEHHSTPPDLLIWTDR